MNLTVYKNLARSTVFRFVTTVDNTKDGTIESFCDMK